MVAKQKATVAVSEDAWPQIHAARRVVERIVETGETVYGINTGFGSLVHERISSDDLAQLQVNLIRSHATAIGELMSVEAVRAMMIIRLNSLCKGHSGIHPDCIHQLVLYLNNDLHPAVPRIGSLGASGDLAPLSHLALTLIGEGYVLVDGERRPTSEVLFERGFVPIELTAKDGLSLINGTSQMTAYATLAHQNLSNLLLLADAVLAMSMDARSCSLTPSRPEVHRARPHPGQGLVAERLRTMLAGSTILEAHANAIVSRPLLVSLRPQVHGAVYESYLRLGEMIRTEMNSATDNPLIFPEPIGQGHMKWSHKAISRRNRGADMRCDEFGAV